MILFHFQIFFLRSCAQWLAPYPLRVEGAVGTLLGGRVRVCGGRSSLESYHSDCYDYDAGRNRWKRQDDMREKRFQVRILLSSIFYLPLEMRRKSC